MVYDMTNYTNATGMFETAKAVNEMANGWFIGFILGIIFFIIIMVLQDKADFKTIMVVASFLTTLVAILFWALELVGFVLLTPLIVLTFASVLIKIFT